MGFLPSSLNSEPQSSSPPSSVKVTSERILSSRDRMPPPTFREPSFLKRKREDLLNPVTASSNTDLSSLPGAGEHEYAGQARAEASPRSRKRRRTGPVPTDWGHDMSTLRSSSTLSDQPSPFDSSQTRPLTAFSLYPEAQESHPTTTPVSTPSVLISSLQRYRPQSGQSGENRYRSAQPNPYGVANNMIWSEPPRWSGVSTTQQSGTPRPLMADHPMDYLSIPSQYQINQRRPRPQLISLLRGGLPEPERPHGLSGLQHSEYHNGSSQRIEAWQENHPPDFGGHRYLLPFTGSTNPTSPSQRVRAGHVFEEYDSTAGSEFQEHRSWRLPAVRYHRGPDRLSNNQQNPAYSTPLRRHDSAFFPQTYEHDHDLPNDDSPRMNSNPLLFQANLTPYAAHSHVPANTASKHQLSPMEYYLQESPIYEHPLDEAHTRRLPVLTRDFQQWTYDRPATSAMHRPATDWGDERATLHFSDRPGEKTFFPPSEYRYNRLSPRNPLPHKKAVLGRPASSHQSSRPIHGRISLAPTSHLPPAYRPPGRDGGQVAMDHYYPVQGQDPLSYFQANRRRPRLPQPRGFQ